MDTKCRPLPGSAAGSTRCWPSRWPARCRAASSCRCCRCSCEGELAGGEQLIGLIVALAPCFSLVAALLAGPYVDRAGRRVTAIAGLSVAVVGALLLIPAEGVFLTALARSIFGIGSGAAAAATITWAVDQVPTAIHGRALSVFGMTVWIGLSAGPQVGQAVFEAADFSAVWATVAGLEALGLLLAISAREPVDRPRPRAAAPRATTARPGGSRRAGRADRARGLRRGRDHRVPHPPSHRPRRATAVPDSAGRRASTRSSPPPCSSAGSSPPASSTACARR